MIAIRDLEEGGGLRERTSSLASSREVLDGTVRAGSNIRILRGNAVVYEGKLLALRYIKDEVEQIDEILHELTAEASQRNKGMAKLPSTLKRHHTALASMVSLTRRGGRQRASLLRNSIM